MKTYKISKHITEEHSERYEAIKKYIGIGTITYKIKDYDARNLLITNTGVMMVASQDTIVTMYALKYGKAKAVFKGIIPNKLRDAIKKNLSLPREAQMELGLLY